jgi:hypothetical protein
MLSTNVFRKEITPKRQAESQAWELFFIGKVPGWKFENENAAADAVFENMLSMWRLYSFDSAASVVSLKKFTKYWL